MSRLSAALRRSATFEPLRGAVFRNLWLASFAANIGMWMNDVTAAWVMTSLTTSPVMVAMVQTASTLPVFLLGLPSGALADIVDRRQSPLAAGQTPKPLSRHAMSQGQIQ
jgi:MFS family permease